MCFPVIFVNLYVCFFFCVMVIDSNLAAESSLGFKVGYVEAFGCCFVVCSILFELC